MFRGIWIPLVTPFRDGEVDHPALRTLVAQYDEASVSGFVALGTTGEAGALTDLEQDDVLKTVLDAAKSLPVVAGVAGNNTGHLRDALVRVCDQPIAGVLVPAPYYVRPSQSALITHFADLADRSAQPLIIYDIPYRTGSRLEIPTLLSLADHPNIHAVKDCAGSIQSTLALIGDGRLNVLAGDDIQFFSTMCLGGHGAISACAHIWPERFVAVYQALLANDLRSARAQFLTLVPLIEMLTREPNPGPVKAALALSGLMSNELRLPMSVATDQMSAELERLLDRVSA